MNVRTANGAILVYLVALAILGVPLIAFMAALDKATAEVIVVLFMFAPAAAAIVALWEISHDVWAPTFAHGFWNSVVQSVLPAVFVADSAWLLGEFGVLAAGGMLILFLVVAPLSARRHRGPLAPA